MPLHPQASKFLEDRAALDLKPVDKSTPAEFRQMLLAGSGGLGNVEPVADIEDRNADGPGGPIPLRIYRPATDRLPALVYFHGGGWVGGNLETHDMLCRGLANAAQCAVVAVDYRLAPEHKFPAAAEDAFAATNWVREHAATLGIDGHSIAVGGDSAGGNLAAAVSLMLRDRRQPAPCMQVLLYPILDYDLGTASYLRCADGYGLTRAAMHWFWQQYSSSEEDAQQPYASPLQAIDLQGLPPALVMTAEFDVLCDEGKAYAERLKAAGVPTEFIQYDGMIHGFISRLNVFDTARVAVAKIAASLKQVFLSPSRTSH